jgi:hypothetical protein
MTRLPGIVSVTVLLVARSAVGQSSTSANPTSPPGRAHHALFYDDVRQRVLLTGGSAIDNRRNVTDFDDLWSFDGARWTSLAAPGDPLSGIRVAMDDKQHTYSLGGFADSGLGVLRLMSNGRWQPVNVNPSSAMRAEMGFVFDAARNRFVAFGSSMKGGQAAPEVWEYDGSQWIKSATTPPPGRLGQAMVYDARRKRTVLFGGMGARRGEASAPLFDDTWEFDGTTWTQARVAGPAPRLSPGITYDSKRGLVLLFGGANHERVLNDLWAWDGTTWKKLAEGGPEARVMGYLAYDKRRDRVVLFGGRLGVPNNTNLGDTWEWDGAAWRRVGS